jgi:hypothetical protein
MKRAMETTVCSQGNVYRRVPYVDVHKKAMKFSRRIIQS